ncbi:helix-turn-helix domain-containing protein [Saccharopolyspora erythraea]|uniref:helix-turn-helix domain-containing protein n=1 Tax=Saccharopolyspora erythraea TaxID=1836 RepID=UPI001BABAB81|nr:helix-turn-helix transcriptional regulator [Saccharopolyspora erythraea]QUH00887.1 helix-turn-helix domain-containing protein [Saccharopolyspora erythraea]
MTPRTDSGWLRRRIGRELRTLREATPGPDGRKITTTEAARELGCTQPKISSIEAGKHRLQWRDVRDLLRFYGASDIETERLVKWAKRSNEPIWWAPFADVVEDWFADLVGAEGEAEREITYAHGVLPGLLQTESYIRALTDRSPMVAPEQRELVVGLRLERQHRLSEDEPLELVALIEESVLSRPVGSPEVMREQLEHLASMSKRDNVVIQVLPTAAGPHAAVDGAFTLLEFAEFDPAVYVQQHPAIGACYSDDQRLVDTFTMIAKEVRKLASSPRESLSLIRDRADEFS